MNQLRLSLQSGLIEGALQCPSPNHDEREFSASPEAIVVHCISLPPGEYGGPEVIDFFANSLDPSAHDYFREIADLKVSSHFFIRRDGQLIQHVPTHLRAWHAGESYCLGKTKANDFTIGIELEGLDTDEDGFTDDQYLMLNALIAELRRGYPAIKQNHIFGHSDIAVGRKPDPGPHFDWRKVYNQQS